jgi:ribosomal protein S25
LIFRRKFAHLIKVDKIKTMFKKKKPKIQKEKENPMVSITENAIQKEMFSMIVKKIANTKSISMYTVFQNLKLNF